jgi:hypothetical protein
MAVRPQLEHEPPPRRRDLRPLRTAITMMFLLGLVVGAAYYSWQIVTEPTGVEEEDDVVAVTTPACAMPVPEDPPPPEEISVHVYNGTNRSGLANQVARELREQGFIILDVANDPAGRSVTAVAEIRAESMEDDAVRLIMANFPGSVFLAEERDDDTIDVVVGEAYVEIGPQDEEPDPDATVEPLPPC